MEPTFIQSGELTCDKVNVYYRSLYPKMVGQKPETRDDYCHRRGAISAWVVNRII